MYDGLKIRVINMIYDHMFMNNIDFSEDFLDTRLLFSPKYIDNLCKTFRAINKSSGLTKKVVYKIYLICKKIH